MKKITLIPMLGLLLMTGFAEAKRPALKLADLPANMAIVHYLRPLGDYADDDMRRYNPTKCLKKNCWAIVLNPDDTPWDGDKLIYPRGVDEFGAYYLIKLSEQKDKIRMVFVKGDKSDGSLQQDQCSKPLEWDLTKGKRVYVVQNSCAIEYDINTIFKE